MVKTMTVKVMMALVMMPVMVMLVMAMIMQEDEQGGLVPGGEGREVDRCAARTEPEEKERPMDHPLRSRGISQSQDQHGGV